MQRRTRDAGGIKRRRAASRVRLFRGIIREIGGTRAEPTRPCRRTCYYFHRPFVLKTTVLSLAPFLARASFIPSRPVDRRPLLRINTMQIESHRRAIERRRQENPSVNRSRRSSLLTISPQIGFFRAFAIFAGGGNRRPRRTRVALSSGGRFFFVTGGRVLSRTNQKRLNARSRPCDYIDDII